MRRVLMLVALLVFQQPLFAQPGAQMAPADSRNAQKPPEAPKEQPKPPGGVDGAGPATTDHPTALASQMAPGDSRNAQKPPEAPKEQPGPPVGVDGAASATTDHPTVLVAQMPSDVRGQQPPTPTALATGQAPPITESHNWLPIELFLAGAMLVFTLIVMGLEVLVVIKAKRAWSPQSILRMFGLTLILSFSIVLIAAGYDKDQISPVMGLLGVIAGYLLGHNESSKSAD